MSLDQARAVGAAMLARRGAPVTLDQRRAGFEARFGALPLPGGTIVEQHPNGLWVAAAGVDAVQTILWLHGGAFVLGSSNSYRAFGAALSAASGARVLLIDYLLSPEHRFPVALDSVGTLLDTFDKPPIVGGDSAGANLAAAALQARVGRAAGCILLSPYLDLTHSGATVATHGARDPFVDVATMPETAATYLGEADPADPRASPLFGPVAGFPPTLIQCGSEEVLADDAVRFAARLYDAGREVLLQQWAGMIHCWPIFADQIDEGHDAIRQIGNFARCLR